MLYRILTIVFPILVALAPTQTFAAFFCKDFFWRNPYTEKVKKLVKDPNVQRVLEDIRTEILAERPPEIQTLNFKGEEYTVIEFLGMGGSGSVYHVKDKLGKSHTIKKNHYSDVQAATNEIKYLKQFSRSGVPCLSDYGYAIDPTDGAIKYRFVNGMDIARLTSRLEFRGHIELGKAIEEAFEHRSNGPHVTKNYVFEFSTGKIIFIDPR